jgi:hypothetical protein
MTMPIVFVAVLAKQKQIVLPDWLERLYALDYPKKRMILYVRSNNNTDATESILRGWIAEHGKEYRAVYEVYDDVDVPVEKYDVHEWNEERFSVLARIRQDSIELAQELDVNFYFVCDVDNFLLPHALKSLVKWDVGVVAPMLTCVDAGSPLYSNYHNVVDEAGYFQDNPAYYEIHSRRVRGLLDIELVHCTYLIRSDVLPSVSYLDDSGRYEYVIFSDNLRKQKIPQYLDNSQEYGVLTLREDIQAVRDSLAGS